MRSLERIFSRASKISAIPVFGVLLISCLGSVGDGNGKDAVKMYTFHNVSGMKYTCGKVNSEIVVDSVAVADFSQYTELVDRFDRPQERDTIWIRNNIYSGKLPAQFQCEKGLNGSPESLACTFTYARPEAVPPDTLYFHFHLIKSGDSLTTEYDALEYGSGDVGSFAFINWRQDMKSAADSILNLGVDCNERFDGFRFFNGKAVYKYKAEP